MKKVFFIAILAVLVCSCVTVPITGRKQISFVPFSQLLTISNQQYREILKQSKISEDVEKKNMVSKVGRMIAVSAEQFLREEGMAADIEGYNWEFTLIEDDKVVNAFCLSGGKIGVYSGMFSVVEREADLATVLAHEVAHAIANHGGERMSQLILVQLGEITLASALKKKPEKTAQLMNLAYGLGAQLGVILPYSRRHEIEADYLGLVLMAKSGYDPGDAVLFWERMSQQDKERPFEFLSTHPAPETRIQNIRKKAPEVKEIYKQ